MKNRDYKNFAPDNYYHIFNRGNAKADIFLDDEDYKFFLWRLRENIFPEKHKNRNRRAPSAGQKERYVRKLLPPNSFDLVCYCLMPNHFHLLMRQNSKPKISELMLRVCGSYSKYFNKKYERVGSLFQDQFKAILIEDNNYLLWLSAYIHNNPKNGEVVGKLEDWKWSSYLDYVGQNQEDICKKDIIIGQLNEGNYKTLMEQVSQNFEDNTENLAYNLNTFLLDPE